MGAGPRTTCLYAIPFTWTKVESETLRPDPDFKKMFDEALNIPVDEEDLE